MSFWQKVTELLLTPIDKFLYPRHSNEKKEMCHLGRKSESRFKTYRQPLCKRESNKKVIHVIWAESRRAAFNTYQQLFVSEAFGMKKRNFCILV